MLVKCPSCGCDHDINPASMMGKITSEAKRAACKLNAQKPRPRKVKGAP